MSDELEGSIAQEEKRRILRLHVSFRAKHHSEKGPGRQCHIARPPTSKLEGSPCLFFGWLTRLLSLEKLLQLLENRKVIAAAQSKASLACQRLQEIASLCVVTSKLALIRSALPGRSIGA